MSFESEKYYLKLCNNLLRQINSLPSFKSPDSVDIEVLRRDLVSRLYYTAFLHCRDTLRFDSQGKESHDKVIQALAGQFRADMAHLKNLRKKADYEMASFPDPLMFKGVEVKLLRLKAVVENILEQDQATLSA